MKIFGIGFHKTGTLSLASALRRLGFTTRHGYKPQSDLILDAIKQGRPPLELVENEDRKYGVGPQDAYLDLYALRWYYPVLNRAYPEAKFILTTRDDQKWLASVHRQMKKRPDSPYFHYWYYQTDAQRLEDKRSSEKLIRQYFADDPNFLEMDITKGDGYKKLCPFLDVPLLTESFPHKNKSPQKI